MLGSQAGRTKSGGRDGQVCSILTEDKIHYRKTELVLGVSKERGRGPPGWGGGNGEAEKSCRSGKS